MAHPILPGRLLDLASDGEARGMIVISLSFAKASEGGGQNSAYGSLRSLNHQSLVTNH